MKPITIQRVHTILRKAGFKRSPALGASGYWAVKDWSGQPQIRVGYTGWYITDGQRKEKLAECRAALEAAGLCVREAETKSLIVTTPEGGAS